MRFLGVEVKNRVEVETQEKGNIGNKPRFCACFVSKKQEMCRPGRFWFLETKHMGFARRFSHNSPVYFVSIFFLRGAPQVGSAGTKKRQIANSCTGSPCICMRTLISIKIFVIITKLLRSGPALSEIPDLKLIKSRVCSCNPLCSRVASQLRRLCYSTI